MPGKKNRNQDLTPFQELLRKMLKKTGESHSEVARATGLHQTSISNYVRGAGARPMRDACIVLADHFSINPNEMLVAAGYKPLAIFDQALVDPEDLSPEVRAFAKKVQKIENYETKRRLINAMSDLLQAYLPPAAASETKGEKPSDEKVAGLGGAK